LKHSDELELVQEMELDERSKAIVAGWPPMTPEKVCRIVDLLWNIPRGGDAL
jgi:hypothetical protein